MNMRIRRFVCLLSILYIAAALSGCAPHARHRLLAFFFDGVPDPELTKKDGQPAALPEKEKEMPPPQRLYRHPAAEGKDACSFCHGKERSFVMPAKNGCLRCHEHIKEGRLFLHGPVAADCVSCHEVHESDNPNLLKKSGDALCTYCHILYNRERVTAHNEAKEKGVACNSCHDPHGEANRYFVKSGSFVLKDGSRKLLK